MEELSLTETETRYFSDLFVCCDVDKTGKIPVLKATELFRSANLSNDAIRQITSISGIPQKALHISRIEFYSCLKLIAAYQASIPLRSEIITSTSINLPLPRFSWKESPPIPTRHISATTAAATSSTTAIGSTDTINNITGTNSSTNNYMVSSITSISSGSGTTGINSDINGLIINEEKRKNSLGGNPITKETINRQWRETNSPDLIEIVRSSVVTAAAAAQETANSDLHSTDSEVEHNESTSGRVNRRNRGGSPEAWSTNSDSPTPTNSVAERPWAKDTMWQGLLGDEHRQLLGTEEESSDRHSSDDDNETDIETIYQITTEQREYYHKQFKAVQPDPNGLLSGHVARVFFEKSRIPVEELRHIWQLCDVTRDGALSLAEFTAAMHLVVLRRNNIPLPSVLPTCLHPTILCGSSNDSSRNSSSNKHPTEPPEADLLHLDDDDDENEEIDDNDEENTSIVVVDGSGSGSSTITGGTTSSSLILNKTPNDIPTTTTGPNDKEFKRIISRPDKNSTKLNTLSNNSQSTGNKQLDKTLTASPPVVHTKNRSISNTPPAEPTTPPSLRSKEISKDWTNQSKEWTKFTESPTSNVSSPGPKPVNFDMQRTAQAVVSDPQILHPVPLRVTPVGTEVIDDESSRLSRKSENLVYDISSGVLRENESSPKQQSQQQHRDSLQNNDLRAIQRPQAKKLPAKNIGAIPPPPQRESSIGGIDSIDILPTTINPNTNNNGGGGGTIVFNNISLLSKKDPPPLPPPRPHRHARSSSLDLNKLKMSGNPSQPEMTTQASLDVQTDSSNIAFADFTQFPESNKMATTDQPPSLIHTLVSNDSSYSTTHSNNTIPPRPTISTLQTNHRASAFEVYRKPNTPRNSQSPDSQLQFQPLPPLPSTLSLSQNAVPSVTGGSGNIVASTLTCLSSSLVPSTNSSSSSTSINAISGLEYDKRVNAISETLRHISLKNDKNITDVLRHLREQNVLLLRLCNDLSDELLTVQQRKEELRCKLESQRDGSVAGGSITTVTGGGAASGSISSNVTGGSTGSGTMHSNV